MRTDVHLFVELHGMFVLPILSMLMFPYTAIGVQDSCCFGAQPVSLQDLARRLEGARQCTIRYIRLLRRLCPEAVDHRLCADTLRLISLVCLGSRASKTKMVLAR